MKALLPEGQALALGRYVLHEPIASGGMARVHLGQFRGSEGFNRVVAVKRLHPQLAADTSFTRAFLEEAQLVSRITHPNVVPTLDVVNEGGELLIVMELVRGVALWQLLDTGAARGFTVPPPIATRVIADVLAGLHAAHEARDTRGAALEIVHRDVSPQNVLVGSDGLSRVLDFGIAKAASRLRNTAEGEVKGKLAYMAPEQMTAESIDRRADLWAVGVMLWEMIAGRRLFSASHPAGIAAAVLQLPVPPLTTERAVPAKLEAVVMKALARDPAQRFASAEEMMSELEGACAPATAREVGDWVADVAAEPLAQQAAMIATVEQRSRAQLATGPRQADIATAAPQPRRRWPLALAVVPVLAAVGGVVVLFTVGLKSEQPARAPAPVVEQGTVPEPAPAPPPEPQPLAPGRASAPAAPLKAAKRAHTGGKRAVDPCDPPYTVDAKGVKTFKPSCL